jgi:hypothetical protein
VSNCNLGLFKVRTQVQLQCVYAQRVFLVTDLGRSSLDGHDLGKRDAWLGELHGSYPMRATGT